MSKLHPRKWPLKIKWIWTESILEPCRKLIEIGCKPHLGPDEISNISYTTMQFVCIPICHNFYGCVKNTFDFLGRINLIWQSKVEFTVWIKWDWVIQIKSNYEIYEISELLWAHIHVKKWVKKTYDQSNIFTRYIQFSPRHKSSNVDAISLSYIHLVIFNISDDKYNNQTKHFCEIREQMLTK